MAASTIIPRLSIIKLPSLSVLFSIPYKLFWIFWSNESDILNTFSCKYYCAFSLKEALSSRKSVMVSKNTNKLSGTFDNANFKEKLISCKVFISDHILCIICDLFKNMSFMWALQEKLKDKVASKHIDKGLSQNLSDFLHSLDRIYRRF